jgi:polysaccharide pyruvyl transferase CsaB
MGISKMNKKIVISGYYGYDNCGDEAVLLSILHSLKKLHPEVEITVLSGNPEKTSKTYNVDAINRWNLPAIAAKLFSAGLLISGGGSLIQDVTSIRSPMYYLGIIRLALLLKTKVMIYSQGVGPLSNTKNRTQTAKVFNRCHAITLRDSASAELLKEIGVMRDLQVTCDPVMTLTRDNVSVGVMSELMLEFGLADKAKKKHKPLLFVSVRYWKNNSFFFFFFEFLDRQSENCWDIILVLAHFP